METLPRSPELSMNLGGGTTLLGHWAKQASRSGHLQICATLFCCIGSHRLWKKQKKGLLFRPKDVCFTGEIKSMISIYGKVAQEERKRKMRRTKENAGKYALVNNQEAAGKELLKKGNWVMRGKYFLILRKLKDTMGNAGEMKMNPLLH